MGKVKNWMMDMEEAVNDAVASDCTNIEDVITHCNENLTYVDEDFVTEYFVRTMGEMYEYVKSPMVRFHKTKFELDDTNYWEYPWEIEAFGRQLGLFIMFCEDVGIADCDEMQEGVK